MLYPIQIILAEANRIANEYYERLKSKQYKDLSQAIADWHSQRRRDNLK